MVKAIIFDCFGVLTTEGWLAFKARQFGDNPELFQEATSLIKQANSGLIGNDDFFKAVAKLAKMRPSEVQAAIHKNVPNEPLFDYIKGLKPKYKIGLLSNVAANYLEQLFTSDQLALLDAFSLSYETGAVKPYIRAYELIAEDLKIDPTEAVLVDDQAANVAGAKQAGMQAILYQNLDQFKAELEPLLAA